MFSPQLISDWLKVLPDSAINYLDYESGSKRKVKWWVIIFYLYRWLQLKLSSDNVTYPATLVSYENTLIPGTNIFNRRLYFCLPWSYRTAMRISNDHWVTCRCGLWNFLREERVLLRGMSYVAFLLLFLPAVWMKAGAPAPILDPKIT